MKKAYRPILAAMTATLMAVPAMAQPPKPERMPLSRNAALHAAAVRFDRMDLDNDGQLSREELQTARKRHDERRAERRAKRERH